MPVPDPAEALRIANIELWLSVRKAEGLKIDPHTAQIEWGYVDIFDPYGVYGGDVWQVGRHYFVRDVGSNVWVSAFDLPDLARQTIYRRAETKEDAEQRLTSD